MYFMLLKEIRFSEMTAKEFMAHPAYLYDLLERLLIS
jgi:hypothetical protein